MSDFWIQRLKDNAPLIIITFFAFGGSGLVAGVAGTKWHFDPNIDTLKQQVDGLKQQVELFKGQVDVSRRDAERAADYERRAREEADGYKKSFQEADRDRNELRPKVDATAALEKAARESSVKSAQQAEKLSQQVSQLNSENIALRSELARFRKKPASPPKLDEVSKAIGRYLYKHGSTPIDDLKRALSTTDGDLRWRLEELTQQSLVYGFTFPTLTSQGLIYFRDQEE